MNFRSQIRLRRNLKAGFTLLEALVAMVVGLVVVGAGFMLFQSASSTSRSTMSRAEMEQNGRAALNFMMQDFSMAATDYQQAESRGAVWDYKAVFGCAGCSISTYPNNLATPIVPYDKNSMNGTSDTITVIYVDNTWPPTAQDYCHEQYAKTAVSVRDDFFDWRSDDRLPRLRFSTAIVSRETIKTDSTGRRLGT